MNLLHLAFGLTIVVASFVSVLCLVLHLFWRNRAFFSRCMMRYQVRPSQLLGAAQVGFGLTLLVFSCGLPITVLQIIYGAGAAMLVAFGVDKFRNPPREEFRPAWFEGDGDPAWLEGVRKRTFPPKISLSWIGVALLVFCITLSALATRLQLEQRQRHHRHAVVTRIEQLGGTVQQNTVSLAGTDVTDEELAMLIGLGFDDLNLGSTGITNAGLKYVGAMSQLFSLNLSGTKVDDGGLHRLKELRLGNLTLRKTNVTGIGFPLLPTQQLDPRNRRIVLDLSLCPVTKVGLECVARTPNLLHLNLEGTDVDDTMLDELQGLSARSLDITGTKISRAALESLQKARPHMNMFWKPRREPKPEPSREN